jgi:Domain of unknown function (DUF3846)
VKAVAVRVDGKMEEIDASYESIKATLDGWLEIVPTLGAPFVMLCDEEGKLKGKRLNAVATTLANDYRDWEDLIVGDVVLTGLPDRNGDHTEYTLADFAELLR